MNCFIAVHHRLFRDGITLLLKESGLVDQFTDETHQSIALDILHSQKFDLIILDCPGKNKNHSGGTPVHNNANSNLHDAIDLNSIRSIKKAVGSTPIVALTHDADYYLAKHAISLGASASISLQSSFDELQTAIKTSLHGKTYISSKLEITSLTEPYLSDASAVASLSKKQKEVLSHLARGESNKVISSAMNISPNTVKAHLSAIFKILGVHNRTEALRAASRAGILPVD